MEKYFSFNGMSTRSEYWGINVISGVASFILILFGAILVGTGSNFILGLGIAIMIATFVAAIWLSAAVAVRRCRDAAINPWWAAAMIIPYIGWIVVIVLGCLKTDAGNE